VKVAIVGASGRLGLAAKKRLANHHDTVTFDVSRDKNIDQYLDIRDLAQLKRAFNGMDVVVLIAALHAPHMKSHSNKDFIEVNITGAKNVADAARAQGVKKIIYTSTTSVFDNSAIRDQQASWTNEHSPVSGSNIYRSTKLAAEELLRSEASNALQVVVLRVSRCFPEAINRMALYRLHRGVDARDIASAYEAAINLKGAPYQVYLISAATPFIPCDAELLFHTAPRAIKLRAPELYNTFKARGWSMPNTIDRVYDCSLASKQLKWKPLYGYRDVITQYDQCSSEVLGPQI